MTKAADIMGTLSAWVEFFFSHVLPIAVSQIYDWLRDWQLLVAVLVVVAAGYVWSRIILKAARQAAKETVQSETRSLDAGLKLLRRQMEMRPEAEAPVQRAPAAPRLVPKPQAVVTPPRAADGRAVIGQLRQAIRLALGTIPLSDDALSPEGERLYRAAISCLADVTLPADGGTVLSQIQAELAGLERDFPPTSCRQAWQSLVKVNALAREFDEPPLTRAQVLAAASKAQH